MFQCNVSVTLVRHLREDDGDRYLRVAVHGASWYAKTAVVKTEKGLTTGNVLKCRIPVQALGGAVVPAKGDYLLRGIAAEIGKVADLRQYEYFAVTGVGDNRRGRFPHWLLTGS